jgi:hypothetical protein
MIFYGNRFSKIESEIEREKLHTGGNDIPTEDYGDEICLDNSPCVTILAQR